MAILTPLERREAEASILDLDFIANRMVMSDDAKSRILINVDRLRRALKMDGPVPALAQRVTE